MLKPVAKGQLSSPLVPPSAGSKEDRDWGPAGPDFLCAGKRSDFDWGPASPDFSDFLHAGTIRLFGTVVDVDCMVPNVVDICSGWSCCVTPVDIACCHSSAIITPACVEFGLHAPNKPLFRPLELTRKVRDDEVGLHTPNKPLFQVSKLTRKVRGDEIGLHAHNKPLFRASELIRKVRGDAIMGRSRDARTIGPAASKGKKATKSAKSVNCLVGSMLPLNTSIV